MLRNKLQSHTPWLNEILILYEALWVLYLLRFYWYSGNDNGHCTMVEDQSYIISHEVESVEREGGGRGGKLPESRQISTHQCLEGHSIQPVGFPLCVCACERSTENKRAQTRVWSFSPWCISFSFIFSDDRWWERRRYICRARKNTLPLMKDRTAVAKITIVS